MTLPDRLLNQLLPISPPYPGIKVWHLVYHLAPFKKNKITLHYHLEQLRKYSSQFNGRKILSCMTGDEFLPPSYVRDRLPNGPGWEIVDAPNNPLHEATSIIRIFDDLLRDTDDQAFMYAHGKSMSWPYGMSTQWVERLYEYTFGSFDRVNSLLTRYPVAGPFLWQEPDKQEPTKSRWFYPGTFFAFRCDVLSKMPWRECPVDSRGWLEDLPGGLFCKEYLGNVSNAILIPGPPPPSIARDLPPGVRPTWSEIRVYQDAFWTRFDAALGGHRYFDAETTIS